MIQMKNTLKKVLCTALAAVSLSAMVTVPSSLNKPNSDNSIINVMEADAAKGQNIVEAPLYYVYVTRGKEYNLRKTPSFGDNVWNPKHLKKEERLATIKKGEAKRYPVYEESKDGKWVRISRSDEAHTRWLYKKRTHKDGSDHNNAECWENTYIDHWNHYEKVVVHEFYCKECEGLVRTKLDVTKYNYL